MSGEEKALARVDVPGLITQAIEKGANIETLERLLALAKDVRDEDARAAWHEAMALFQSDVPDITKSKTAHIRTRSGDRYSYTYAPLQDLIAVVRPALAKHGLSVTFDTTVESAQVRAKCIVAHALGHTQTCEFIAPIDQNARMNSSQAVGSASTYARRYAYLSALGLAPEDDDDGAGAGDTRGHDDATYEEELGGAVGRDDPPGVPRFRGKITGHEMKKGGPVSKPWELHKFKGSDGQEYVTFDTKLAAIVMKLGDVSVEIIYEETSRNNRQIVEIRAVEEPK